MGCLFEFFGELILEVFLEGSVTLLGHIFPAVSDDEKRQKRLKVFVTLVACVLVGAMFFGALLMLFGENVTEHNIGLVLLLVPTAIIMVYIIFCFVGAAVAGRREETKGKAKKRRKK